MKIVSKKLPSKAAKSSSKSAKTLNAIAKGKAKKPAVHSINTKPSEVGYSREDIYEMATKLGRNPMAWFAGHIDDGAVKRALDDKRTWKLRAHNSRKCLCILGQKRQNGVMKARVYAFETLSDGEYLQITENIDTGKHNTDVKAIASLAHIVETYGKKNVFLGTFDMAKAWATKTGATIDAAKGKALLNG